MWTKTKRTVFSACGWIVAGIISTSLLTGCGGGSGGDDSQPAEERLIGTWRVTRIEAGGQSTACAGEINYVRNGDEVSVSCGANDTVTFLDNGSFSGTSAGGGPYAGMWQVSGNTLTINVTTPSTLAMTETERINFSDDNTFTSNSEDNTTSTFVRQ